MAGARALHGEEAGMPEVREGPRVAEVAFWKAEPLLRLPWLAHGVTERWGSLPQ